MNDKQKAVYYDLYRNLTGEGGLWLTVDLLKQHIEREAQDHEHKLRLIRYILEDLLNEDRQLPSDFQFDQGASFEDQL